MRSRPASRRTRAPARPLLAFTLPFNLAGVPSITLPMGPGADGVPMGFQFVGPELGEGRLLAAGVAWERVSGFAGLHPRS